MHPAYSVIVFTCASGAGYGLLAWLAIAGVTGGGASRPQAAGSVGFALAFALITIGLLSSTVHLGRPERAWRAFSQWRTSWLSREGVMAVATYVVGGAFASLWLFGIEGGDILFTALAASTAACALATVWCTGMIYASLRTIRAWSHALVAPLYVLLALTTGRLLLNAVLSVITGTVSVRAIWLMLLLLLASWIAKAIYWSGIDEARKTITVGDATGLGQFGRVRPLDPPHTQANFVMREMGYVVARRHVERLRQVASVLVFVLPIGATLLMLTGLGASAGWLPALVSVLSAAAGVLVERWLFFAEAEHVAMLFYGRDAA